MKDSRQSVILQIISNQEIETQAQLIQALAEHGISSTQATLSRDIKQLHLVKELSNSGKYHYVVSGKSRNNDRDMRLRKIFRESVTSYAVAQNIIVIHTLPGLANAAASALDAMNMNVVLGTLAGDDTVVVIMRDTNAAAAFCGEIKSLIGG